MGATGVLATRQVVKFEHLAAPLSDYFCPLAVLGNGVCLTGGVFGKTEVIFVYRSYSDG